MRPLHAAAAVLTILVMGAAIGAGGRAVLHDENGRVAARAQAGMAAQSDAPATAAIPRPKA
ncbi:MAG: thermonuclease family protein, partial [Mesorhizobium sp.]